MSTQPPDALLHLLQLASPALPVGAYAYSQGLESAVEARWITDETSAHDWIGNVMTYSIGRLDAPVLMRLLLAWQRNDMNDALRWNQLLQAARESKELLLEDRQMGDALLRLLVELDIEAAKQWPRENGSEGNGPHGKGSSDEAPSFATMFALAATHWKIPEHHTLKGFLWSWLENQVAGAVKLVPLGQTQAQRLLIALMPVVDDTVRTATAIDDNDIGSGLPRLALASMQHETQYSRLFRS